MPELAEVARIVYFIRQELVGKTVTRVDAQHDDLIFGKVGTSADEFKKHMLGKEIIGAGQQGKYFWIAMSSPPHPVMHFGMTGWIKINGEETYYHPETQTGGTDPEWPPKFWKFLLETKDSSGTKREAAFTDSRRLGRVRLVDCPAEDIRNHTPLKENGPDPVADKHIVTEEWLRAKLSKKKVPIKAFLLDQAQISGIGNWMGYVRPMRLIYNFTNLASQRRNPLSRSGPPRAVHRHAWRQAGQRPEFSYPLCLLHIGRPPGQLVSVPDRLALQLSLAQAKECKGSSSKWG